MTQVHFTMTSEEIKSLIEYLVKYDISKKISAIMFNQLMKNRRAGYVQADEYER